MAILAQTHVTRADYEEAVRQYRTTAELRGLDEAILTEIRNRRSVGGVGELELIQAELTALQAVLRQDLARADVENAFGRFHVTLGADPVPESLPNNDLATLAAALAATEQSWRSGTPGGAGVAAAAPASVPTPAPVEVAAVP